MSQQINLFNPIFLKQKKVFTAGHIAQVLGVIAFGALAIAAYGAYSVGQLENQVAAAQAHVTSREAALVKVKAEFAPREKSKFLQDEAVRLQAELVSMREAEGVLKGGDLGNTSGYAEYFRAFARQNVPGLWLTGLDIVGAGKEINVRGKALQAGLVPGYIGRLTQEPVLRGKTFGSLQIGGAEAAAQQAVATPAVQATKPAPYIEFRLQSHGTEASK
ncbi:hypothetical protein ACHMW6_14765 [Pseudoduganella sp. UC29_106]|uniref:hypothetical protein n=1 Tax=Pseudoduganella sp. UC29_106 TaxID=3374553 RepID=UPI0037580064